MVGGLRYLVHTRPHIAFAVGIVSRYMERPTELHLSVVKRICRYVKRMIHYGLVYTKGQGNYIITRFSDSDTAGSLDDRKSTGGMAFYLDENLVTGFHKNSVVLLYPRARLSSWLLLPLRVKAFGSNES